MATMRVHKTGDYTVMSNRHFREKGMSLKAKGLMSLMLSLPDDWDYSVAGLATLSKDGKDGVNAALRELERFGYLVRTRTTDAGGKFTGYDYDIYEEPVAKKEAAAPYPENPYTAKPSTANPQQSITYLPSTKQPSTKQPSTEEPDKNDKRDKTDKKTGETGFPHPAGNDLVNPENENTKNRMDKAERIHGFEREYLKPTALTKILVKAGYLSKDDPYIPDYNSFLGGLVGKHGYETVRDCVSYFVSRIKGNREGITNRKAYFEAAMLSGIEAYTRDWSALMGKALGIIAEATR